MSWRKWISCLGVLFVCGQANADDIAIGWDIPTDKEQCTDGGSYDNPAGTRIWQLVTDIPDPTAIAFTLIGYTPGDYTFVATSYDTDGVGSRISGEATKTVTSFIATAGKSVYQPVSITNGFWLLPVGKVSADVQCIIDQNVNGKYAIPTTSVSWSQGVIPKPLVVADCS